MAGIDQIVSRPARASAADGMTGVIARARAATEAQTALAHVTRMAMLGEMSASIAHEVNQPLAAIVTSAESSLRWLNRPAPVIEEVRVAVGQIVKDAHRAGEVIRRIRQFSKKSNRR